MRGFSAPMAAAAIVAITLIVPEGRKALAANCESSAADAVNFMHAHIPS